MIKLKKCPFCGSENVAFTPDDEQPLEDTTTGFIWCHGCDFTSDSFYSEETAAKKWNRREAQP
jgi:Lar family restriction alleviation protein